MNAKWKRLGKKEEREEEERGKEYSEGRHLLPNRSSVSLLILIRVKLKHVPYKRVPTA